MTTSMFVVGPKAHKRWARIIINDGVEASARRLRFVQIIPSLILIVPCIGLNPIMDSNQSHTGCPKNDNNFN